MSRAHVAGMAALISAALTATAQAQAPAPPPRDPVLLGTALLTPAAAHAQATPLAQTTFDAAYAGVAAVCPELRWLNDGLELADSYATNPHKWLLTNFDCDAFWVADPEALVGALSVLPEFLRNAAT